MPLRSAASPSEESSRFYQMHQSLALEWEDLAKSLEGTLEGEYNSYYLDLELNAMTLAGQLQIEAYHHLSNTEGSTIPINSTYQSNTRIRIKSQYQDIPAFELRPKSMMTGIVELFRESYPCRFDSSLLVTTNDLAFFDRLFSDDAIIKRLVQLDFIQLKMDEDGLFEVSFNKLLSQEHQLPQLIEHFNDLLKR